MGYPRLLPPSALAALADARRRSARAGSSPSTDGAALGDLAPRRLRRRARSPPRSSALAVSFRGEPLPLGPWRDYVTLTKPRIMSLLLITGAAGMFVGAEGLPPARARSRPRWLGLALACGGASALNHVLDADIDRLMGSRTEQRPVASGSRTGTARARVRARPLGALVRAAREHGQPADRGARARRQPVLRRRLHALSQARHSAEHRHRRRRRSGAAARRLRCRNRQPDAARRSGSS